MKSPILLSLGLVFSISRPASSGEDAYLDYVRGAQSFGLSPGSGCHDRRWDTWIYMPWRYQWTIGTG